MKKLLTINKQRILSLFLVSLLILAPLTNTFANQVNDVTNHWGEEVINEWLNKDLSNGYPNGSFKPDNLITRAEFMTLINKAFGFVEEEMIQFHDVSESAWYTKAIKIAKAAGYIEGYPDRTMKPNNAITRQEAAIIISKIKGLENNPSHANSFLDAHGMLAWSKGQIGAVAEAGYMSGYPDESFKPANPITRAEALISLDRALYDGTWIIKEAGTYGLEEETDVYDGDVIIKADGSIVQNITITGDLIITEEVGEGEVTLNNVTVEGDTYIQGGGTDSIYINGGSYNNIIIQRTPSGAVRVVVTGQNRLNVEVDEEAEEQIVILDGFYDKVIITAPNVRIITRGETQINELMITGAAKKTTLETSEDSVIEKAILEGDGTIFEGGRLTVKKVEGSQRNSLLDKNQVVVRPPSSGSSGSSTTVPEPENEFAGGDGSEENPYQVATAQQLDNVRNHLGKHFIQIANVNLGVAPWNEGEGWEPIGDYVDEVSFRGIYDGQNYSISNQYIDRPEQNHVGLFGYAEGASFKNINIVDADVTGKMGVGALVGIIFEGNISKCTTSGLIMGYHHTVGGLTGYNYRGQIDKSSSSGSVTAGYGTVGGLAGRMFSGSITKSYSTADVANLDHYSAGGLVGSIDGVTDLVQDCYATGDVHGVHENGGLAGRMISSDGLIENAYAIGTVSGTTFNGGLIGNLHSGTIQKSYHNGPDNTVGSIKTNDALKEISTYVDWVFPNIWTINNTDNYGYPALAWQNFNHTIEETGEFAGGLGTQENPYQVATAEQLNRVRDHLDKHFIQTADIDLGVAPWNEGEGWEPIGDYVDGASFQGIYDGGNYRVEGLYINRPTKMGVGMFGEMTDGASVKNLKVVDVDVKGLSYVGAISGGWGGDGYENSSVINVHVSGTVKGTDNVGGLVGTNSTIRQSSSTTNVHGSFAGGLVGLNVSGHAIEQSYATGEITGTYTGGLVGHNNYGTILDSYSLAQVKGTGLQNGGVIGVGYHFNSVLTNVFAAGEVDSGGGLIGVNHNGGVDYEVSGYWDKEVTGKTTSANSNVSFGKETLEMLNQSTFAGWDFATIWSISEGASYPYLKWQNDNSIPYPPSPFAGGLGTLSEPYEVSNAQQLDAVRYYQDKHFIQTANINLDLDPWNTGEGWEPIMAFEGSYDGNAKNISNIMINRPAENYVGLFGDLLSTALIQDLVLENANISGNTHVGIATGRSDGGTLRNISASGTIISGTTYVGGLIGNLQGGLVEQCDATVNVSGFEWVGGLVGSSPNATISKSSASGSVDGTGRYVGGLVGVGENVIITESHASGEVTGTSHTVGGLIGSLWGVIEESYAAGSVSGNYKVGGLVGDFADGTIKTSYASGSVNGMGVTRNAIGGLVGYSGLNTFIENSYATGSITGNSYIGGLIGINNGTIDKVYAVGLVTGSQNTGGLVGATNDGDYVKNSFWNKETTGQTTSDGSDSANGKTTAEMKVLTLYETAGWIFSNIWTIDEGNSYPYLQ